METDPDFHGFVGEVGDNEDLGSLDQINGHTGHLPRVLDAVTGRDTRHHHVCNIGDIGIFICAINCLTPPCLKYRGYRYIYMCYKLSDTTMSEI